MRYLPLLLAGLLTNTAFAADKLTIAVIPKGTTHVYWKTVEAGARKACQDLGADIVYVGTAREDERSLQMGLVDTQVLKGVNGIVLAPLDSVALRKPVEKAVKNKIPVVIFDSPLEKAEDVTVAYVGTDNRAAGAKAAEALAKLLGEKGKVIMLRYVQGSASTAQREEGFLDGIKKYLGISILSAEQYGGATDGECLNAAKNLLLRFSGDTKPDGIYCPNQTAAFGMLQALRQNGLAGKIKFIGFDPSAPLVEALEKGEIDGLISQDPYRMGYLAVETMVKNLKGEKVEKVNDTGSVLVTKENLPTPDIQKLVAPMLGK